MSPKEIPRQCQGLKSAVHCLDNTADTKGQVRLLLCAWEMQQNKTADVCLMKYFSRISCQEVNTVIHFRNSMLAEIEHFRNQDVAKFTTLND